MKKIFLFAAAMFAALTVNAKVYDFSTITKDDVQTTATVTEEMKDGAATGKLLIAVPSDQSVVEVILFEDIKLHYNSDKEANITIDTKNGYFEFPGNGKTQDGKGLVTVENVTIGDNVVFELANKGSKDVSVTARDGAEGADVALPAKASSDSQKGVDPYDANGYVWVNATFKATAADLTVSAPGSRVRKITVGEAQGIGDVTAGKKAIKRFENGQLVIIKNGVRYNAIGVKL